MTKIRSYTSFTKIKLGPYSTFLSLGHVIHLDIVKILSHVTKKPIK